MEYTIISINDDRAETKQQIRTHVNMPEVTDIPFCDGRKAAEFLWDHPRLMLLESDEWTPSTGEEGIWYSQLSCWDWAAENRDLLTFEDDAMISSDFMDNLTRYMDDLPDDWDFFSLYYGDEQIGDYNYNKHHIGSDIVTKAWQGYSSVCTGFSQRGGEKLFSLSWEKGMYTPADCFLFIEASAGELNGYGLHPDYPKFVHHDYSIPSIRTTI